MIIGYIDFKTLENCEKWLNTIPTGRSLINKNDIRKKLGLQQYFNNTEHIKRFCNEFNASVIEIAEF